jgi:hypothetical protein
VSAGLRHATPRGTPETRFTPGFKRHHCCPVSHRTETWRSLETAMERTGIEPVTSGLQIQFGAGPRPSANAASVSGSQIEELVRSAPAALGQRDLTKI